MESVVKFSNLSTSLKVLVILDWIIVILFGITFLLGFIEGVA